MRRRQRRAVNDVTTYQYPKSFGVTEINGAAVSGSVAPAMLLERSQIYAWYSTNANCSRLTHGTCYNVSIFNESNSTIDGPFQVVFELLTDCATLGTPTGSFGGWPFMTFSSVGSLSPSQAASVLAAFNVSACPAGSSVVFAPVIYTGSFN